ncbi:MAG: endo-1,4-beta-xylanase, partial [Clostridia bacterium]|nr:endo-1,4-beta-xylanase [Clostridia bacterium]
DSADALISWAKANGVGVRGHCLLWYKSLPSWLHDEFYGVAYSESVKASAYEYIGNHIETVMEHFGDDVYVWDVVNEALRNYVTAKNLTVTDGAPYGDIWRTNENMSDTSSEWVDWFKVTGGYEYIAYAFKKAAEVRAENHLNVELYYNDYSLNDPNKRQACLNLIQMLKANNAPIDGIGMQAHYKLSDYTANKAGWIKNFEDSVKAFIEAGVDVQITELDIRFDGVLTEQIEAEQAEMYGKIFEVVRKYAKTKGVEHGVTGVTLWGVYDGCNEAWGKDQYPLVFGSDKQPKQAYYAIIKFT